MTHFAIIGADDTLYFVGSESDCLEMIEGMMEVRMVPVNPNHVLQAIQG